MNVLVFGGNGFLGVEIENELKNTNHIFFSASRNILNKYQIDISNYEEFSNLPDDFFDIVINCATVLPGGNVLDNDYLNKIYNTNILGAQNICKWITTQKSVKKIINCSTLVVIKKPWIYDVTEHAPTYPVGNHVLYCSSKLMQELLIDTVATKNNIDFVNVRFSAIYGDGMPKSGVIWALCQQAKNNSVIKILNGNKVSFDFIHVKDAAKTLIALIESKNSNGILNVASGIETSLFKLATIVKNNFSEPIAIENNDETNFIPNLSKVNVDKLNTVINTNGFLDLTEEINRIFKVWL
ncbi:NAD-dependent epimerase/dehydratase family protein [Flavobacterium sp. LB1P62]|uniref:NAD-dependent epimerase/dehydratase family protein n=1 Tax=Flavobacterium sp. LB1P62 TaxID=3401715 RepID=UPI003AB08F82